MNYLHAYHAGNFADVVKHLTMVAIIGYLQRKEAPIRVIDMHAGSGRYTLKGKEARATGEAASGIARLLENGDPKQLIPLGPDVEQFAKPYMDVIIRLNPGPELEIYPGSPLLVRHLLRANDRLTACELRDFEFAKLQKLFAGDPQVLTRNVDSWKNLKGFLPPDLKRALILMDPPFEKPHEMERAMDAISMGVRRFPMGIYMLWYPIKARYQAEIWAKSLAKRKPGLGVETILRAELYVRAPDNEDQLNGTGLFIINPPYRLQKMLEDALPVLQRHLQQAPQSDRFLKTCVETL